MICNDEIDVGCEASRKYWDKKDQEYFVEDLVKEFGKKINGIYEGIKIKDADGNELKIKAEIAPYLTGYWGKELHTMTSQCSKMGIPTFQFEMAPYVRAHLAQNDEMLKKWAHIIVDLYQNMIAPNWTKKVTPIRYFPALADKVHEQKFTEKEMELLIEEYHASDDFSLDNKLWF